MYESHYVEIYDLLMRNRPKDYAGQAAEVARIIRQRNPAAASLLDLACGTGLHLRFFAKQFDHAVGLDQSEDMLRFAKTQIEGIPLRCGDMRNFEIEEKFDAITCMFAIPHVESAAELESMIECLVRHLEPGGVVVIEPWYSQDEFIPGYVATDLISDGARQVFRVSHSVPSQDRSDQVEMVVHYIEAESGSGIQHFIENAHMTLLSRDHYEKAFAKAGCAAEYVRAGDLFERGLWVARRAQDEENAR